MAISPLSDLVLDVARAADPQAMKDATLKLSRLSRGAPAGTALFAEVMDTAQGQVPVSSLTASPASRGRAGLSASQSPAEKFEALVLHQFVETMLPDDAGNVFGEGATGEIWKSMLAEQVGNQMAASGGIGIADLLSDNLKENGRA